jgi:hypothetical protein
VCVCVCVCVCVAAAGSATPVPGDPAVSGWICVESGDPGKWQPQGGSVNTSSAAAAAAAAVHVLSPSKLEWERGLQLLEVSHGMAEGAAKERVIDHANRLLGLQ